MNWITDWNLIDEDKIYIVTPINAHTDGTLYLSGKMEHAPGWKVKRYMQGCYAALLMPKWDGVVHKPTEKRS